MDIAEIRKHKTAAEEQIETILKKLYIDTGITPIRVDFDAHILVKMDGQIEHVIGKLSIKFEGI